MTFMAQIPLIIPLNTKFVLLSNSSTNFVLEQDFHEFFKKNRIFDRFFQKKEKLFSKKKFVLEREISTNTNPRIILVLEVRARARANFTLLTSAALILMKLFFKSYFKNKIILEMAENQAFHVI